MRVGDKIDSDHQPVKVWIKGRERRREGRGERKRCRGVWNEEGSSRFRGKLRRVELGGGEVG